MTTEETNAMAEAKWQEQRDEAVSRALHAEQLWSRAQEQVAEMCGLLGVDASKYPYTPWTLRAALTERIQRDQAVTQELQALRDELQLDEAWLRFFPEPLRERFIRLCERMGAL